MKNINLIILLLSIFLIGCNKNSENEVIYDAPFNIKNLDNIVISSSEDENLNNQGYYRQPMDVILFEKKKGDIIIQLQFDQKLGSVLYKVWYVKLKEDDLNKSIDKILSNYDILALRNFSIEEDKSTSFPVVRNIDNNIFLCDVYKEEGVDYLKITYYKPLKEDNSSVIPSKG